MHHRGKFVVLVEVRKLDCMRDLNLGPSKKKTTFKQKTPAKKNRTAQYGAFLAIFPPFKNLKT